MRCSYTLVNILNILKPNIGDYTKFPSYKGLREYAITSALKDSRFSPITRDEFSRLTVSISILQVTKIKKYKK